ncbi:MAG: IPT/TIG domain-containing protein, partial [Methanoregulaceae archaeon]
PVRGTLALPSSAAAGSSSVFVPYAGATAVDGWGLFTMSGSVATITGDSLVTVPASGWSGTYYVYGTGFSSGAQVWVRSPTGVLYVATSETTLSPTTVRGTLVIPSSAAAGSYSVYVQNPGATAVYRTGMFTKSGSTPASISTFSPNYATRGVSKTVYVYGSNFQPGAQVIIYKGGATALQATGETFINSNTIRCVIYVSTSQPNGYYYGGVINPGMGFYPKSNAFYLY